ncbi:protein bunched, class 2/F/G isoform-like [Panonychus citri]|uniref:protein bunched, class 2/F/G isoform-like n=1 Tax=Panonychus citri TaxID=50023 RepID=UPI0023080174|nr:protein bunched, class 2/F/G isoform-like [Panonychus citri]
MESVTTDTLRTLVNPVVSAPPETPPITVEEWQHRFKVVKIASKEPMKRGRWSCMDFNDPPSNISSSIMSGNTSNSTTTTVGTSVNTIQSTGTIGQTVVTGTPLAPGTSGITGSCLTTATTCVTISSGINCADSSNEDNQINSEMIGQATNNQPVCIGVSGVGLTNIDSNTIPVINQNTEGITVDEKTFDHLMSAVREEVVVLKERINELTSKITQLEFENGILRTHATQEVLTYLYGSNNQNVSN